MSKRRPPARRALKVLFIGNSFTARNDLPVLVAKLAAASSRSLDHHLISVGGASLRTHWNKGEATQEIRRGGYGVVVLQEQSTLPIKNPLRMHENIRLFDEVIEEAGAATALYLTWARRNASQAQQAITDTYTSIAEELGATVIPAGVGWQAFERSYDQPVLYDRDGSHPSLAGSFLAACVAFAVLFDASPEPNVPLDGISQPDAKRLARTAARVVEGWK